MTLNNATMYEYFDSGKNNNVKEIYSINTTNRTIKHINACEDSIEKESFVKLVNEVARIRNEAYFTKTEAILDEKIDKVFFSWNMEESLNKIGDVNMIVEEFLKSIKVYPEYMKCFMFNEYNKENIWIILSDSTCENSDLI